MEIMCRQGVPDVILTDQGPQFVGTVEHHRSEHQTTELPVNRTAKRHRDGYGVVITLLLGFFLFFLLELQQNGKRVAIRSS